MEDIQGKENILIKSPMSPSVLKPKPLCFRKKPRRLLTSQPLSSLNINLSATSEISHVKKSPAVGINPFRICSEKRKRDSNIKDKVEDDLIFLAQSKNFRSVSQNEASNSIVADCLNENANSEFNKKFFQFSAEKSLATQKKDKLLPVDWSLKTKVRLISKKPFPWRANFKTSEEASGTTGFVRCLHSENQNGRLDSSYGAKFFQQCLVWMYPSIPWMKLFPRNDNKVLPSNSLPSPLNSYQQEIMHSSWCDSLRSLYQLVRTYQCPFFYLCSPNFTVMFRAAGVGSILNIHAFIAPTTRGLRNALKDEGIEFTMPLHHGVDQDIIDDEKSCINEDSVLDMTCDKIQVTEDNIQQNQNTALEDAEEEEEPGTWLESLGLSQDDFPSLNPNRNKLRREYRKTVDHRLESLVYVEDADTQALVNFLLNYPSCMAKLGPMAGIPPTLLSPVSFLGSSLQAHKICHSKVNTGGKELYTVEVTGPLLPNTIHAISTLFSSTQDGDFSATLTSHSPTLAFSKHCQISSSAPLAFAVENLRDCGLPSAFIAQMCSSDIGELNTITAESGLFSHT